MKILSYFLLLINFSVISKESVNHEECKAHTNIEAKKECYSDFGIPVPVDALEPKNMRVAVQKEHNETILAPKNTSQPQRYVGMANDKAAMFFNTKPNSVNNIIFDNYDYHVLLESSNQTEVSFVQILFKKYKNCSTQKPVPANFLYEELDIDVDDLILLKDRNNNFYFSSYFDPSNNIITSAYCFSENYYFVVTFQRDTS